ncbi:MAG TPA: DUF1223 domain-containing protein [Casimicrobiaceae bacterium]|nr:DUF1223 domain-containing protein [Casimicrobiaceae bacterium]
MNASRAVPILTLACCTAIAEAQGADPCRAASGERSLPLVEVYTSEGCSSCPPADRWLSATFAPAGRGAPAAALAFHVDYWDRLGWPDRFARASWTARQQAIAHAARSAVVYTPQVVFQGRGTTEWSDGGLAREIATVAGEPARAAIAIVARPAARRVAVEASARVPESRDRAGARLVVAYTDSGHVTRVQRGENAGVTLTHDHVVRALVQSDAPDASGKLVLATTIDLPADAGHDPQLVAFVERHREREVLQALVLRLDVCVRRQ